MSDEKVCKPGFNDCDTPGGASGAGMIDADVCLPGFNSCGIPDTKDASPVGGEPGACLPGFNSCVPEVAAKAINETKAFDKSLLKTDKLVLMYFSAPWCTHCKNLSPIVEEVVAERSDEVSLIKIDIDADPETAKKFQIVGVPTIVLVKDMKVVDTAVGGRSKEAVIELIDLGEKEAAEGATCKPGFNSCDEPTGSKGAGMVEGDTCLPGFNSCGTPGEKEAPASAPSGDGAVCKPGFNSCD